jgi:hypothetical protein
MPDSEYLKHLESSSAFMSENLRTRINSDRQTLSINMLITNLTGLKLQIQDVKKIKCSADNFEICALLPPAAIDKVLQIYQETNNIIYGVIRHDSVLCEEYSIEYLSSSAMIVTLLFSK